MAQITSFFAKAEPVGDNDPLPAPKTEWIETNQWADEPSPGLHHLEPALYNKAAMDKVFPPLLPDSPSISIDSLKPFTPYPPTNPTFTSAYEDPTGPNGVEGPPGLAFGVDDSTDNWTLNLGGGYLTLKDIFDVWRATGLTPELAENALAMGSTQVVARDFTVKDFYSPMTNKKGIMHIQVMVSVEPMPEQAGLA